MNEFYHQLLVLFPFLFFTPLLKPRAAPFFSLPLLTRFSATILSHPFAIVTSKKPQAGNHSPHMQVLLYQ
jgi:hypothetical protein